MEDFDPGLISVEEIVEDLILFHDPDKIKNTLDLLVECYAASTLIDTHSRGKKMDIYNHINKIKEFLDQANMWQDKKFSGKAE
jgi:hypothetical protein